MGIYVIKNGNQTGPFTEEQTRGMVSAGMLLQDDFAWKVGTPNWQPLHLIRGISPSVPEQSLTAAIANSEPKGVGGWLLFFCVSRTILSPLFLLGWITSSWQDLESAFLKFPCLKTTFIWEYSGFSVLGIYGFIAGCVIWGGNRKGRSIAQRLLLVKLFGVIGIELIALLIMCDLPKDVLIGGIAGAVRAILGEAGGFLIWWFYFKKSRRVRNTYGDANS